MEFYSNIVGFVDNFDNYLVRDYLLDDTVFTRKGKISYRDAVMYPLVEKGCTSSLESLDFVINKTGDEDMTISRTAFGQKRRKIDSGIYEDMNEDLMNPIVESITYKGTYKGFYPVAMDSTICDAPNTLLTYDEFNHIKFKNIRKSLLRLRASCICDVTHGFHINIKNCRI